MFLTELLGATNGRLPDNFVVTLPKIQSRTDVETLVDVFEVLEDRLDLDARRAALEIMVETTQSIFDPQGRSIAAAPPSRRRRAACVGAHFGTYDYTANCDITAAHQKMRHPACDFAKHMMKVAFAGTGVMLSDGATNIMPVAPHKGRDLTDDQKRENQAAVFAAWRLHADDVRHSLVNGFYQGWDLHPAQLVAALRRGLRVLPRRASRRRASGSRTSSTRPRRRRWSATCSTTRRPGRACSTTSCAASRAAR